MIRGPMAARKAARFLAPIALAATIAGTYLIVHDGLKSKSTPSHHSGTTRRHAHGKYARAKFYVIQGGDSMSSIAAKTGVNLNTLEDLNRSVDPNSLQTGQRLRLRR
jgi:LysM repeat protein